MFWYIEDQYLVNSALFFFSSLYLPGNYILGEYHYLRKVQDKRGGSIALTPVGQARRRCYRVMGSLGTVILKFVHNSLFNIRNSASLSIAVGGLVAPRATAQNKQERTS